MLSSDESLDSSIPTGCNLDQLSFASICNMAQHSTECRMTNGYKIMMLKRKVNGRRSWFGVEAEGVTLVLTGMFRPLRLQLRSI